MALDLYKLEHLIAVAEEGAFTRAAERLHLSQQALSTSIRSLEREVGVQLLDRSRNQITVLPAGEALIADARALHGAARSAVQRARRIGRGESETLRIGHTPAVTSNDLIALLNHARGGVDDLATEVNQRYPDELTEQLLDGQLDLGLSRAMRPERGLSTCTVTQQRLRVAVDAGHRFAERGTIPFVDLADESILVWGHPGRSGYTDLLVERCRQAGFEPAIQRTPLQGTPPVTGVIGTQQVALVTAPPGTAAEGGASVLELEPASFVPLQALWPEHANSHLRDVFLSASTTAE